MDQPLELKFTVPGPPRSKGRPRLGRGGHVYTPPETVAYENLVRVYARKAMAEEGWKTTRHPVKVAVKVYLGTARKSDLDNYGKILCDSMNRLVYADDSQVTDLFMHKRLNRSNPRVEVEVQIASWLDQENRETWSTSEKS